ncbi:MAG: NADAR family protein [Ignavibacteriaceae bacterium]
MEKTITKVKEDNGWLSCMSPHPVTYNGVKYRTCEALFQSRRFNGYPEIQKEIIECKSPMGAKMIARKNREKLNRGVKWDEAPSDIPLMKECLELKLEQHPDMKEKLIATGKAKIIEDCTTHDRESARFWGAVRKDGQWIGENVFGKLWMEIREELVKNLNKNNDEQNS